MKANHLSRVCSCFFSRRACSTPLPVSPPTKSIYNKSNRPLTRIFHTIFLFFTEIAGLTIDLENSYKLFRSTENPEMETECTTTAMRFSSLGVQKVQAGFDGGAITSDAGSMLLREADKKDLVRMMGVLMETFIGSYATPPASIVLDFDATDLPLHGEQEWRFFHDYYDAYCYLPLYVFCCDQLLVSHLRPSRIDTAKKHPDPFKTHGPATTAGLAESEYPRADRLGLSASGSFPTHRSQIDPARRLCHALRLTLSKPGRRNGGGVSVRKNRPLYPRSTWDIDTLTAYSIPYEKCGLMFILFRLKRGRLTELVTA